MPGQHRFQNHGGRHGQGAELAEPREVQQVPGAIGFGLVGQQQGRRGQNIGVAHVVQSAQGTDYT